MVADSKVWLRVAAALFGVGWGANQFNSMLLVYKLQDGFGDQLSTAAVAVYVLGLMPALLVSAWVSAHVGKRVVLRPLLIVGALASVAMIIGAGYLWMLFVGRLLAGVAAGGAIGPGVAWVKELCVNVPPGTGARRSAMALTGGFATGPLVAAGLAQVPGGSQVWPFLVHLLVMIGCGALAWNAPELDTSEHPTPSVRQVWNYLGSGWFRWLVLPIAPWVFTVTCISFVTLPVAVAGAMGMGGVLVAGLVAFVTMVAGILVQPSVRRLEARRPGVAVPIGMALVVLGLVLAAVMVAWRPLWLLAISAPLLGASYGFVVVAGLQLVERHVSYWMLAPITAVYYCLAYLGFFAPLIVASVGLVIEPGWAVGVGAVLALAALVISAPKSLAEGDRRAP